MHEFANERIKRSQRYGSRYNEDISCDKHQTRFNLTSHLMIRGRDHSSNILHLSLYQELMYCTIPKRAIGEVKGVLLPSAPHHPTSTL